MDYSIKKRILAWGLRLRPGRLALAAALFFGLLGSPCAFEIPTENEDIELRWDNTFKYNLGYRVKGQDDAILKNANSDDGDRNFDKGIVSNRIDILSELDIQYKKRLGARISAAAWYDQRYSEHFDNNSPATSNHMQDGHSAVGLSTDTKRLFNGPNGELLDAFVFGKFDAGSVPINLKVGRHTVYWGESLMLSGAIHGVAYAQMPIDVAKAFSVPGSEAKELYRPLFNISTQAQLADNISLSAQYFLQWEPFRFPEAGSYLGFSDVYLGGGESFISGATRYLRGDDREPSGTKDWGVAARWSPQALDATIGLYFRRLSDKLPQLQLDAATKQYFFVYGDNINLYGVSFSKQILGVSVGAEASYRENMPLISEAVVSSIHPTEGDTLGARGNTWHGLVNAVGTFKVPFTDIVSWSSEVTWNHWSHVTQGDKYFKGRLSYNAIDAVTEHFFGFGANLTPTWYQVFPGMDLSMPLSFSMGLSGNSAITLGGNEHTGNYGIGLGLDVYSKYRFDLKYVGFFGDYTVGTTGAVTAYNGPLTLLKDRDMIAFTMKVTY